MQIDTGPDDSDANRVMVESSSLVSKLSVAVILLIGFPVFFAVECCVI